MKKNLYLMVIILAAFVQTSEAQNTAPLWASYYQGAGDNSDRINKIVPDGTGNFIGVGYTIRKGNYRDFLTVKINANGDTLWWRTKNGKNSGADEAVDAAVDALGNVYVTGYTDDGNLNNDVLLIKYNSSGTKMWDTTWNGTAALDDIPVAIALDGTGNIFVAGNTAPDTVSNSNDYMVLKFDPNGGLTWHAQYSRPAVISGRDEVAGLVVDTNGDAFVTGRSYNGGDDDMVTMKFNGVTGAVGWTQIYNSSNGNDRGTAITLDPSGNIIITGRSPNTSNDDIRTIKYNPAGVLQWSKTYNGPANQNDRGLAVTTDASGNVFVAGQSDVDNSSTTDYDYVTLKFNATGTLQWSRTEGSNTLQYDIPAAIVVDALGNVFVTGKSDQNPDPAYTENGFMTVMYNSVGTHQWTKFHSGSRAGGSSTATSVRVDASGVYVAGGAENNVTDRDGTVIKYDLAGNELFVKDYNGEGDYSDVGHSLVVDANDNVYVGGYSFQEDHNRDICLVAINSAGDTTCTYLFNGSKTDDDELNQLAIDANGFVYATGYTKSSSQKSDFFTMKWDPSTCQPAWISLYDDIGQSDKGISLAVDAAGNVYMTGRSDSDPRDTIDNLDIVTIKYNMNGNQQWLQRYNGVANLNDEPVKLILDNNGNVIVTGISQNVHDDDFIVLKYDASTGNPVWANPALYNGPFANDDRPLDITVDAANDIFVCGYSQTGSGGAFDDAVVVKYDASGNQTGFFGYDGTGLGNDDAVAITHDFQDNIIVTMKTDVDPNPTVSNYNYLTLKFNNALSQLWNTPPQYNDPINGDDVPVAITTDAVGDVFVTGYSDHDTSAGRTNSNWVTVRYNNQGIQTMVADFDGPNATDDIPYALALRGSSLWVCGYAENTGLNQRDLTTLRYDLSVGIPATGKPELAGFYPNPMTGTGYFQTGSLPAGTCSIRIMDNTGRIVSEFTGMSGNKMEFQRGSLLSGLYHFEITDSKNQRTFGKFIIQ